MTPQLQLFRNDPAGSVYGDCWRSALACLLDLPVASVPHFFEGNAQDAAITPAQHEAIRSFFAARGEMIIDFPMTGIDDVGEMLTYLGQRYPGRHHLLAGRSASGSNHAVIVRDGAIVHDTHPDKVGVLGPCDDGYYWLTFIGRAL